MEAFLSRQKGFYYNVLIIHKILWIHKVYLNCDKITTDMGRNIDKLPILLIYITFLVDKRFFCDDDIKKVL